MASLNDVLEKYDQRKPLYNGLGAYVDNSLRQLLLDAGIKFHDIEVRIKGKDATEEKFLRSDKNYRELEDIKDIVGVRVITYFEDLLEPVDKIIKEEFSVIAEHSYDRRKVIEEDQFGYLSVHYACKLSPERLKVTENRKYENCVFEIQSRSILQHAWAEIEHAHYKSRKSKPAQTKRRNSRLAGLFELADAEFISIRKEMENYEKLVNLRMETSDKNLSDLSLDSVSVLSFIEQDPSVTSVDEKISTHFNLPMKEIIDSRTVDIVLAGLTLAGISSLQQLRDSLSENKDQILEFLTECIPKYKQAGIAVNFETVRRGTSALQLMIYLVSGKGEKVLSDFYTKMNGYEDIRPRLVQIQADVASEISRRSSAVRSKTQ